MKQKKLRKWDKQDILWYVIFSVLGIVILLLLFASKAKAEDKKIPIICYHHIKAGNDNYHLKPEIFKGHLDWLQSAGYETVTFKDVWELGPKLPPKPIVLTFDDGPRDHWQVYQDLKARGMKGVFFIVTNAMLLKPWQLVEMDKNGMEIGSHTKRHMYLTRLPLADFWEEVNGSEFTLRTILGHKIYTMAYPFGAYDQKILDRMKLTNYIYVEQPMST